MAGYIGSKSSVTQVDGYSEAEADAEFVNDPNGAITVSGSNVGIGTSNPTNKLFVESSTVNSNTVFVKNTSGTGVNYGLEIAAGTNSTDHALHVTSSTGSSLLRVNGTGNVGIGTSSPNGFLDVAVNTAATRRLEVSYENSVVSLASTSGITGTNRIENLGIYGDSIRFYTDNTTSEAMRIDSSGNLLVGQTSASNSVNGTYIRTGDRSGFNNTNSSCVSFNRLSSDGDIVEFRKDGSSVGTIGNIGSALVFRNVNEDGITILTDNGQAKLVSTNSSGLADNDGDIGAASYRWDDVYATNGTIQTSDFNEKQDIASLTATEMLVGKRISALFKTFRWKDSVVEKGDNARTHTGVIAQDVQAAFTAEGLDAGDYALFISSTWWEHDVDVPAVEAVEAVEAVTETTTDEEGNEVVTVITEAVEAVEAKDAYTRTDTYDTEAEAPEGATEKTRLGIRYPELFSFVAAYNEQRFASIEARLTALEA